MRKTAAPAAIAALALAVTACGSGTPAPLTASQLARKIPGCSHPHAPWSGVYIQAQSETECLTPDATVEVGTFATVSAENAWFASLDADGTSCDAIQGNGWAAMLDVTAGDDCGVTAKVAQALGGRMVTP